MKHNGDRKKRTAAAAALMAAWIGLALSGCASEKDADSGRNPAIAESGADSEDTPDSGNDELVIDQIEEEPDGSTADTQDSAAESGISAKTEGGTAATDDGQPEIADTGDLYERFLNNEAAAVVTIEDPEGEFRTSPFEKGSSYTFEQLGQQISAYFLNPEYTDKTTYDYAQYAYVNSPDSVGARKLLLKFVGLNIYSPDDDSYAVVVLSEENGRLYVTAEYECWARSATIAYGNGTLSDDGSGGAGDHYSGRSVLLSDGTITSVYETETLYGWWASYIDDAIYNEVFGENTEPGEFLVSIYTIGDDTYHQYEIGECTEEQKVLCETYISRCHDEKGIEWASDEEVQNAIRARCDLLGISFETTAQQPELAWNTHKFQ